MGCIAGSYMSSFEGKAPADRRGGVFEKVCLQPNVDALLRSMTRTTFYRERL